MPALPKTKSSASAASGPYAAELSASSPNTGTPARGPSRSPRSSESLSGRPKSKLPIDIAMRLPAKSYNGGQARANVQSTLNSNAGMFSKGKSETGRNAHLGRFDFAPHHRLNDRLQHFARHHFQHLRLHLFDYARSHSRHDFLLAQPVLAVPQFFYLAPNR